MSLNTHWLFPCVHGAIIYLYILILPSISTSVVPSSIDELDAFVLLIFMYVPLITNLSRSFACTQRRNSIFTSIIGLIYVLKIQSYETRFHYSCILPGFASMSKKFSVVVHPHTIIGTCTAG